MTSPDRRRFLCALPPLLASGGLLADESATPSLIPRQRHPDNFEFPYASLDRFLTPNSLFYIRSHFEVPKIDPASWRLQVAGAVERPLELTLDQVRALPSRTAAITLECAGNGRAFLVPKTKGVQWETGAVSTAEWTGVPLATVLEGAGVKSGAVEVVLEGTDRGEPGNDPKPPGKIAFARSLPLAKANKPEVLLAWAMNGKDLSLDHGFPLRAVVGGWYGMASVKWLTRLLVVERPFRGYWQTVDYATWRPNEGEPALEPITEILPKASIAQPVAGSVLPAGKDERLHGAAWSGESEVAKVEVSTDDGRTWTEARLLGKSVPFAWRLWEHTWRRPEVGKYSLRARATDRRGRTQPTARDPGRRNYVINHVLSVAVEVRAD